MTSEEYQYIQDCLEKRLQGCVSQMCEYIKWGTYFLMASNQPVLPIAGSTEGNEELLKNMRVGQAWFFEEQGPADMVRAVLHLNRDEKHVYEYEYMVMGRYLGVFRKN